MKISRPLAIACLIILPALLRGLRVDWNIVPIGAISLFVGARFRNKSLAMLVPMLSMFLGDMLVGLRQGNMSFYAFHSLMPVVYGSYLLIVGLGCLLERYERRRDVREESEPAEGSRPPFRLGHVLPIAGATLTGSFLFFLITNFGDWLLYYDRTPKGLAECYWLAIPFFRATMIGDLAVALLLFGGQALASTQTSPAAQSSQQL